MVAVSSERCTRGFNCKTLTGKMFVFWIGSRLLKVVAHESFTVFNGDELRGVLVMFA